MENNKPMDRLTYTFSGVNSDLQYNPEIKISFAVTIFDNSEYYVWRSRDKVLQIRFQEVHL